MQNQETPVVFDKERASSYDSQYSKLASLTDALHMRMRVLLSDLPAEAQVLCVGAGTGAELLSLAAAFPSWRFTALDPAAPMLDICRRRAADAGIAERCTFHTGYLDSLPPSPPFDAATSILVSHFIVDPAAQQDFFRQIAARLRPGGAFVNAAVVATPLTAASMGLLEMWLRMQRYAGIAEEQVETMRGLYGKTFAAQSVSKVEALIAAAGFEVPTLFFQTLLIHAWYAKRAQG